MVAKWQPPRRILRLAAIAGAAALLTLVPIALSGIWIFGDPIFSETAPEVSLQTEVIFQKFTPTTNCYTRYESRRGSASIEAIDYCWGSRGQDPFYFPPPEKFSALWFARPHWTNQRKIGPRHYGISMNIFVSADLLIKDDPGYYPGLSQIDFWSVEYHPYGFPDSLPKFNVCGPPYFCRTGPFAPRIVIIDVDDSVAELPDIHIGLDYLRE